MQYYSLVHTYFGGKKGGKLNDLAWTGVNGRQGESLIQDTPPPPTPFHDQNCIVCVENVLPTSIIYSLSHFISVIVYKEIPV
jgi:hypothetical protein